MNARYTPLFIGLLIGIAFGLLFGWVIHPVELDKTTPSSLQDRYRADLVLMVAEAYANEGDLDLARQRLSGLGFRAHNDIVENALNFAKAHDFGDQDIEVLSKLLDQLASPAPTPEINQP